MNGSPRGPSVGAASFKQAEHSPTQLLDSISALRLEDPAPESTPPAQSVSRPDRTPPSRPPRRRTPHASPSPAESPASAALAVAVSSPSASLLANDASTAASPPPTPQTRLALSRLLTEVESGIQTIKRDIFVLEEKRHAASYLERSASQTSPAEAAKASQNGALDGALMSLDEHLHLLSTKMVSLDRGMENLEEMGGAVQGEQDGESDSGSSSSSGLDSPTLLRRSARGSSSTRSRRDSSDSDSSLASFDAAIKAVSRSKRSSYSQLQERYQSVLKAWTAAQADAELLKRELADDKYLVAFRNMAGQLEGMMDSLDKALAACHTFVFEHHRQGASLASPLSRGPSSSTSGGGMGDGGSMELLDDLEEGPDGDEKRRPTQLETLQSLRRTFEVKQKHYGPACHQVLAAMDRSLKDRATSNGTVLRRYSELRLRWRQLKERLARMDRELLGIEGSLSVSQWAATGGGGGTSPSANDPDGSLLLVGSPASSIGSGMPLSKSPSREPLVGGLGTPGRSRLQAKGSTMSLGQPVRSPSSGNLAAAAAQSGVSPPAVATPPPKPPKSTRRMSMFDTSSSSLSPSTTSSPSASRSPMPAKTRGATAAAFGLTPPSASASASAARHHARTASASLMSSPHRLSVNRLSGLRTSSVSRIPPPLPLQTEDPAMLSPTRRLRNLEDGLAPPPPPSSYRAGRHDADGLAPRTSPSSARRSRTPQPEPTWARAGSEPPPPVPDLPSGIPRVVKRLSRADMRAFPDTSGQAPGRSAAHLRTSSAAVASSPQRGVGVGARVYAAPGEVGRETPPRPSSAIGTYYRPPSATGVHHPMGNIDVDAKLERSAKRMSMIPRLTLAPARDGSAASDVPRPGSSLSQSSATAYSSYGGGGGSALSRSRPDAHAPPSGYSPSNRLSMQTPEPQIAARAARFHMFARPSGIPAGADPASRRSSRPPTTRYHVPLASTSVAGGGGGGGGGGGAASSVTSPLTVKKRLGGLGSGASSPASSTVGLPEGAPTPLSAAALAALPDARRSSRIGYPGGGGGGSSVANFRAQRAARDSSRSVASGRVTPTFSEGGASSMGGYGGGGGSVTWGGLGRGVESYRANPWDALDVEVARIVNAYGVALERVDAPLPRGVKAEPRPGRELQARYNIGRADKVVACKLLELHRPTGTPGSVSKVKKAMCRVGGAWQDLEQYVLNLLQAE